MCVLIPDFYNFFFNRHDASPATLRMVSGALPSGSNPSPILDTESEAQYFYEAPSLPRPQEFRLRYYILTVIIIEL